MENMNEATGVNEPGGPAGDSALREPVTAVCCSGGGIRSASFNLGALQELGAQHLLHDAKHILGVSGGAYIAAARSVVAAKLPPDDGTYARGSVEEDHLRDNSRYLLPDGKTALRGAMFLVLGLAFNLTLLLAWIFIMGHTLGWLFEWQGVLRGLLIGQPRFVARWWTWIVPAVLGGAAVLVFLFPVPPPSGPKPGGGGARDWGEWKSRTVWILAVSTLVSALAFLAAPRAIQGLYDVGRHDGGNLGMVVRGTGFATPSGCKDAAKSATGHREARCAGPARDLRRPTRQTWHDRGGSGCHREGRVEGGAEGHCAASRRPVRVLRCAGRGGSRRHGPAARSEAGREWHVEDRIREGWIRRGQQHQDCSGRTAERLAEPRRCDGDARRAAVARLGDCGRAVGLRLPPVDGRRLDRGLWRARALVGGGRRGDPARRSGGHRHQPDVDAPLLPRPSRPPRTRSSDPSTRKARRRPTSIRSG